MISEKGCTVYVMTRRIEWRLIRREGTYDWGLSVKRLFRIGDEKQIIGGKRRKC